MVARSVITEHETAAVTSLHLVRAQVVEIASEERGDHRDVGGKAEDEQHDADDEEETLQQMQLDREHAQSLTGRDRTSEAQRRGNDNERSASGATYGALELAVTLYRRIATTFWAEENQSHGISFWAFQMKRATALGSSSAVYNSFCVCVNAATHRLDIGVSPPSSRPDSRY